MRPFHLIANWKAHHSLGSALDWLKIVGPTLSSTDSLIVCPPFPLIIPLKDAVVQNGWPIGFGAQAVSCFGEGPYTGEVPASLLSSWVQLALVGHSERRTLFGETSEQLIMQLNALAKASIPPALLTADVEEVIGMHTHLPSDAIIVYEPPQAISTNNPSADSIEHALVCGREFVQVLSSRLPHQVFVYYGGSVDILYARKVKDSGVFDGVLIGKASLDPESMGEILHAVRTS